MSDYTPEQIEALEAFEASVASGESFDGSLAMMVELSAGLTARIIQLKAAGFRTAEEVEAALDSRR